MTVLVYFSSSAPGHIRVCRTRQKVNGGRSYEQTGLEHALMVNFSQRHGQRKGSNQDFDRCGVRPLDFGLIVQTRIADSGPILSGKNG